MLFQPEITIDASNILDAELIQRLTAWVDAMPGFAPTVQRIVHMSSDINCSPRELVHVIETDPVLMIKVLKVVNSEPYGFGRDILSVNQAVAILGVNTIKNLALGIAGTGMLPAKGVGGFDAGRYLVHSLTVAAITKLFAMQQPDADPLDYYIAGLLHDFGKVMIAQYKPSRFRRALDTSLWEGSSLHANLQAITGHSHEKIFSGLLESWGFKKSLVSAIRMQYQPATAATHLVASLYVSNLISKGLSSNEPGFIVPKDLPGIVQSLLGGDFATIVNSLGDLSSIFGEARKSASV